MSGAAAPRRRHAGKHRAGDARIGLALAGGGPLGGIYEVGALLALSESLDGLDFGELDVYVGVSSGGFVAAALANGISPPQMYRLFIQDGGDAGLSPSLFLRPALREFARRALSVPGLLARATADYLRHPWRGSGLQAYAALGRAIPTGVFDQRAIDAFLTRLFTSGNRTNDFRELSHRLFLVATELDTGNSITFGGPFADHVPISKAIQASAALPGLFPPVRIEGRHYVDGALNKTLHASVALDRGVQLLLCINPLVPFDASMASRRGRPSVEKLDQGGLPRVLAQTFRAIIHSRLKAGMEKYRQQYPDADVLLFEPDREDADMFFANIFSYAHREKLCEAAYQSTRRNLRARQAALAPLLARHGVGLNLDRLDDTRRSITGALTDPRPLSSERRGVRQASRDLAHTLDHLEAWLATASATRA
jgi:predicted acylesterase/phospholipase RssA